MNVCHALQQHGLRVTPQRVAVYEYLLTHPIHPSAETIYEAVVKQYPHFSRTTIYNSLHALEEAGLLQVIAVKTGENRFDGNPAPHGHFRCTKCERVLDFPLTEAQIRAITPDEMAEVQLDTVLFSGICQDCYQNKA